MDNNPICHSCTKRNTCDFAKDLDRALNGLGSMVSGDTRAQIHALVSKEITSCQDYQTTKQKFYVTYQMSARYVAEVEADNIAEAIATANHSFSEADFGSAEDIDGAAVNVQDADGNFLWEKQ